MLDLGMEPKAAVGHFRSLLDHPGWKLYQKVIAGNLEIIQDMLITKIDANGNTLTEAECDILRADHRMWSKFRDTPVDTIKTLEDVDRELPNYDPFATSEELTHEEAD